MSDHTEIRLETPGGTVVAYFAPNFETTPVHDNDLLTNPIPDFGRTMVARDRGIIQDEITVQGVFEHSENLPSPHRDDLESASMFDKSPVTPRDQVNRIRKFMHVDGGPFHLYDGSDEYQYSAADVDWAAGKFPPVQISQFRPPTDGGVARHEYMVQFAIGVQS